MNDVKRVYKVLNHHNREFIDESDICRALHRNPNHKMIA